MTRKKYEANPAHSLFAQPITSRTMDVDVADIVPPRNVRTLDSVREEGVLQNIGLCELQEGDEGFGTYRYKIVYGNRRVNSAIVYGHPVVPARIVPASELQQAALCITENGDRSSNLVAEAHAVRKLIDSGMSPSDIQYHYGMQTEAVKVRMRLSQLDDQVLDLVERNTVLSETVALRIANLATEYRERAGRQVLQLAAEVDAKNVLRKAANKDPLRTKYTGKMLYNLRAANNKDAVAGLDDLLPAASPLLPEALEENALAALAGQVVSLAGVRAVDLHALIARLQRLAGPAPITAAPITAAPITAAPTQVPASAPQAPAMQARQARPVRTPGSADTGPTRTNVGTPSTGRTRPTSTRRDA